MATMGTISIELENKFIAMVTLRQDAYPMNDNKNFGCGLTLLKYYNKVDLVNELISHGNIYSLQEKIEKDPTKPHQIELEKRQRDVCFFYKRDSFDKGNHEPKLLSSLTKYKRSTDLLEWNYIFRKNEWFVYLGQYNTDIVEYQNKLVKLKDFIENSVKYVSENETENVY